MLNFIVSYPQLQSMVNAQLLLPHSTLQTTLWNITGPKSINPTTEKQVITLSILVIHFDILFFFTQRTTIIIEIQEVPTLQERPLKYFEPSWILLSFLC